MGRKLFFFRQFFNVIVISFFSNALIAQPRLNYLPLINEIENANHFNLFKKNQELENIENRQLVVPLTDSIYNWIWLTSTNSWKATPQKKTSYYVYDNQNNILSKREQNRNGNNWINSLLYTNYYSNNELDSELIQEQSFGVWADKYQIYHSYDINGNRLSNNKKIKFSGQWINYQDQEFTYDLISNKKTSESYLFNWVNNLNYYQNGYKYTYTYSNNQMIELHQNWNHFNNAWESDQRNTYSYTINFPDQITSLLTEVISSNIWINGTLQTYTYNNNNKKVLNILKNWNYIFSSWEIFAKDTFIYNSSNDLIENIRFEWDFGTNSWDIKSHGIHTWDSHHNETSTWNQSWNTNAWKNEFINTYYFTNDDLLYSEARKTWNNAGTLFSSGDSTSYYFHLLSGIEDQSTNSKLLQIFPNPTSENITFQLNDVMAFGNSANIALFDNTGRIILQQIVDPNEPINISSLSKGIYFIEVRDLNGRAYRTKIIKN